MTLLKDAISKIQVLVSGSDPKTKEPKFKKNLEIQLSFWDRPSSPVSRHIHMLEKTTAKGQEN